jgi:hypothetical protein
VERELSLSRPETRLAYSLIVMRLKPERILIAVKTASKSSGKFDATRCHGASQRSKLPESQPLISEDKLQLGIGLIYPP